MFAATTRPIRPELFGTGGSWKPGALARLLAQGRIGCGPLRFRGVENAILVPGQGILTADGETLRDGQVRRYAWQDIKCGREHIDPVEPAAEIDGEAMFAGWLFLPYGHFLIESLARWWAIGHLPPDMPALFLNGYRDTQPLFDQRLAPLGIDLSRVRLPQQPIRIRRLILPDLTFEIGTYAHERMASHYQALGERLCGKPALTSQPLYLSRAGLPQGKRKLADEAVFEEFLRGEGFLIRLPDTLPIPEQIAILRSHHVIVGPIGSAFHATLVSAQRPTLHLFTSPSVNVNYVLCADAADTPTVFVNCLTPPETVIPGEETLGFDMAAAAAHLHAAGLVRHPSNLGAMIARR